MVEKREPEKREQEKREPRHIYEIIFACAVFLFCAYWAYVLPANAGPDETMRYSIPQFIYHHNVLPHGGDPAIMSEVWGTSYAFLPILSYMISAFFMKAVSLFAVNSHLLLWAARLVSSMFLAIAVWYVFQIGRKLFPSWGRWIFACLVMLLPQVMFMGVYVNNDAMAICCSAAIVYYWIRGIETQWSMRSCVGLGIWLGLCMMSYMNAYGYAVCSVILFTVTCLFDKERDRIEWKKWLKCGIIIALVALAICGWWFVRNYIIYDGDWLGLATSNDYADVYAYKQHKPSLAIPSGRGQGMSLVGMLTGVWTSHTFKSFIGCFGQMTKWMEMWVYLSYCLIFLCGAVGYMVSLFGSRKASIQGSRMYGAVSQKEQDESRREATTLEFCLFLAMIIPVILNIYHSYWVDFQPQGRYCLAAVVPLMYFITKGLTFLAGRYIHKKEYIHWVAAGFCLFVAGATVWEFCYIY